MPTYEYRCSDCGHEFEELQSITAKPLIKCPACGKPSLKRLVSGGGGMIFKGNGFYLTDYKKKESKPETPSRSTPKKKTEKSSESPASPSTTPADPGGSKPDTKA